MTKIRTDLSHKFPSGLRPEDRVLLRCARLTLDEGSRQTLDELLRATLDWQELLNRAIAQGVAPLLYKHLRQKPEWWRGVPKFACDRLEMLYHHNTRRNELLQQELDTVLAILHEADISVILMKELHLLHTIYPDPGLRPLGDLDLLVRCEDFAAAKKFLAHAGYRPELRHNPYKERHGFGYHLINHEKNIWIDLQWNLCQREWQGEAGSGKFRPPIQQIWQRAAAEYWRERRVWKMSWEDLLLHLCVHAEGHYWGELIQFCDIAAVIQRCDRELDWPYLLETATAANLEASLYCTLRFVHEIWNVAMPEEVFKQLRPAYLPFEIYYASFGAFATLHTFLDEAANDPALPPNALQNWERVTVDTVAQNYRVYQKLDAALEHLSHAGLTPVACMSQEPERTVPHLRLHPRGEIAIFVAANTPLNRNLEAQLNTIGGDVVQFKLRQEPDRLKRILHAPAARAISTRQQFKKILSSNRPQANGITIYPLAAEELLLVLCRRFSRSASWLDFCTLAEFLMITRNRLDWPVFWDGAQEHRLANAALTGLLCARELTPLEIPASAFAPMEILPSRAPLSLCAMPAGEFSKPAELQSSIDMLIRFMALPSWRERRQYAVNLVQQLSSRSGGLFRFGVDVIKRFAQWRRVNKISPQAGVAPSAYWLETPQIKKENLPPSGLMAKVFQPEIESI